MRLLPTAGIYLVLQMIWNLSLVADQKWSFSSQLGQLQFGKVHFLQQLILHLTYNCNFYIYGGLCDLLPYFGVHQLFWSRSCSPALHLRCSFHTIPWSASQSGSLTSPVSAPSPGRQPSDRSGSASLIFRCQRAAHRSQWCWAGGSLRGLGQSWCWLICGCHSPQPLHRHWVPGSSGWTFSWRSDYWHWVQRAGHGCSYSTGCCGWRMPFLLFVFWAEAGKSAQIETPVRNWVCTVHLYTFIQVQEEAQCLETPPILTQSVAGISTKSTQDIAPPPHNLKGFSSVCLCLRNTPWVVCLLCYFV